MLVDITDTRLFCVFSIVLIIAVNFLGTLLPCRFQNIIENNIIVKHLFGFFISLFLILLSTPFIEKNFTIIFKSLLVYAIFILMTKTDIYVFLILLLISVASYSLVIIKTQYIEQNNIGKYKSDKTIKTINTIVRVLYNFFIIILLVGVLVYMGEQKIEYKDNFSYIKFFLGNSSCKNNNTQNISIMEKIKNIF